MPIIGVLLAVLVFGAGYDVPSPLTPPALSVMTEKSVPADPATPLRLEMEHVPASTPVMATRGAQASRSPQEDLAVFCVEYGVVTALAEAIIWTESRWVPDAMNVNTDGSVDAGRFQLNSGSWPDISDKIGRADWDPFTPLDNMQAGVEYLAYWTRYWAVRGYAGADLTNMVISSFAAPSATVNGEIQWWYINRIRSYLGWGI